jgi:hypothetical protein
LNTVITSTGKLSKVNETLTPKVPPPPPRHAQNRSGFWSLLQTTSSPAAVTLDQLVAGQTMPPLAEANPSTEHQSGNAHSHAAAMRDGAIDRVKAGIDIGVARAAPMRTSPSAPWMATSFISETSTRSPLVVEYPA